MLVNGWTFEGACCSSYGYTMSFRASAQQDCEKLSTRDKQSCDKQSSLLSSNSSTIFILQNQLLNRAAKRRLL